jgi:hypothetical protein
MLKGCIAIEDYITRIKQISFYCRQTILKAVLCIFSYSRLCSRCRGQFHMNFRKCTNNIHNYLETRKTYGKQGIKRLLYFFLTAVIRNTFLSVEYLPTCPEQHVVFMINRRSNVLYIKLEFKLFNKSS